MLFVKVAWIFYKPLSVIGCEYGFTAIWKRLTRRSDARQQRSDRISQLRDGAERPPKGDRGNLEEVALSVLEQLGEIKRPYLTQVEEKLLSVLEREYGVE